jgi:threonine dehydratase
MVSIEDIRTAHAAVASRIHRTPVFSSRALGERTDTRFFFKAECLQKTGSFKVRGVFNKLRQLTVDERARGVISISAGNHAQSLAYGAREENIRCTVVMPAHASRAKVAASEGYGATIVLHGDVNAAFAKLEELRREGGYTLVHPYDDDAIIAGQGTVGVELVEDVPDVDAVIVPVGGGGLIAGIATAVKALRPGAKVYGVEPEGAAGLRRALDEGRVVRLEKPATVADGLAAPMTSERVLEHVRAYVDDVVTLTDAEILSALPVVLERTKILVEAAGAAGFAALLARKLPIPAGATVAVVASGGNIDLQRLKEILP